MICFTNDDRIGGDPKIHDKYEKLDAITRRLFILCAMELPEKQFANMRKDYEKLTGHDALKYRPFKRISAI